MSNSVVKNEDLKLICDFHVHTPASKCYETTDTDYIKIVYTAITKGLDTICITDHNTILGYIKIIEKIAELKNEYSVLKKYDKISDENLELINNIEKLDSINIIPGIELTTDPGIHIILLFDPNKKVEEILEFLKTLDIDGNLPADEEFVVNQTTLTVLEMAKNFGCITIAPHVDSDKGAFNTLEAFGSLRAKIFSSSNLDAITCNNVKVESKIRNLTTSDENYKRNIPLAVVYGSDAHNLENIAKKKTFIRVNKKENIFSELKNALLQYINCISNIANIEINQKIKKYLDYGIFICIKDLDYEVIKKSLCAMLNNMFGQILIGIGQNNEIVGIASSKEQLLEDINIIFNEPDSSFKNIIKDIEILELSHECYVAVISVVNVFEKLYGLEDLTYFYNFKNKNIYKPSIAEVEKYIKNKIYKRLEYIQNKNVTYQKNIIENLEMISKPFYQMSLHNKLLNKGVLFLQAVEKIYIVNDFYNVNINFPHGNGNLNGKYYYSMDVDIRIDDAILRYSCPVSENIEGLEIKDNIYEPGEYIVMKKTGASFYINSNEEWYYCSKDSSDIIINSSSINTKVLLAWLKSSFYIFYCFFDEKVENITDVNTIPRLFLPDFNKLTNKQNSELEKIVIEILSLEQQYLCNELDLTSKITNKKINNKEYESKYYSLIREHNKKVSDLTREIDSLFMEILDITNDERKYVSHCIKQKGLYDLY